MTNDVEITCVPIARRHAMRFMRGSFRGTSGKRSAEFLQRQLQIARFDDVFDLDRAANRIGRLARRKHRLNRGHREVAIGRPRTDLGAQLLPDGPQRGSGRLVRVLERGVLAKAIEVPGEVGVRAPKRGEGTLPKIWT